jgi:hypothetical protein
MEFNLFLSHIARTHKTRGGVVFANILHNDILYIVLFYMNVQRNKFYDSKAQ